MEQTVIAYPAETLTINSSDILYIVSCNEKSYMQILNGKGIDIPLTLSEVETQLHPSKFIRINTKTIIGVEHIVRLENETKNKIVMRDKLSIHVASKRKNALVSLLSDLYPEP